MKQFFRFAAAAAVAAMTSFTAFAQWTQPVPDYTPIVTEDTVYIYNVGTGKFLNKGEAWGTQAVVADQGFKFVVHEAGVGDGIYTISTEAGSGLLLFRVASDGTLGGPGVFVDGAASKPEEQTLWNIASNGTNTYTMSIPPTQTGSTQEIFNYVEGQVAGVQTDHISNMATNGVTWGLYYDVVYAGNEANCTWAFVSKDAYATLLPKLEAYNAAQKLKEAIEAAEAQGVDVAEAQALYNNTNSTADELTAAADKLAKATNQAIVDNIDPANPTDMSELIPNHDFSTSHNGWTSTMTAQNDNEPIQNNTLQDKDHNNAPLTNVDAYSGKIYENWDPSPMKGKMYTKIGVPNGAYVIGISAHVQTLDENNATTKTQYVYANNSKTLLTSTVAKRYQIIVGVDADSLEVGYEQTDYITNWCGIDEVTLTAYGSSLASYQALAAAAAGQDWEDEFAAAVYAQSYYDAVTNAISGGSNAATKEEALAKAAEVVEALAALRANADIYEKAIEFATEMESAIWEIQGDNDASSEALDALNAILDEHTASTADVQAAIDAMDAAYKSDQINAMQPGQDVTNTYINNPTFSESGNVSKNGWTLVGGHDGGNNLAGGTSGVCEVWNGNFNISQQISLPKGAYTLSIRNFYRTTDSGVSYGYWNDANGENTGNNEVKAKVFADNNEVPFTNIYAKTYTADQKDAYEHADNFVSVGEEDAAVWTPNGITSANDVFKNETDGPAYEVSVNLLSAGRDYPVNIGLKAEGILSHGWAIWDDFKLTYIGTDVNDIQPILDAQVDKANALATQKMNADSLAALTAAVAAAQSATDGNAMIDAYRAILKAMPAAQNSANAYARLKTSLDNLAQALVDYDATAAAAAKDKANSLNSQYTDAYNNGTIADADISTAIAAISLAINDLKVGDVSGASDTNPSNMTDMIVNPTFNTSDVTAQLNADGWTVESQQIGKPESKANSEWTTSQYNVSQGWSCNFDIYQTIQGLPEGTYAVVAQGFNRFGSFSDHAAAYRADTLDQHLTGEIYANNDTQTLPSVLYMPQDDYNYGLLTGSAAMTGWSEYVDSTREDLPTYFIPNQRQHAQNRFTNMIIPGQDLNYDGQDDGAYTVRLFCYVDNSGLLRLGFRNMNNVSNGWTVATNFQLFYLGENSSHESTTAISGVNSDAKVAARSIYTVDGRQVNSLQKGLNIVKTTDVNGNTTVQKIIKK